MKFYDYFSKPNIVYYGISLGIVLMSILTRKIALKFAQCISFKSDSMQI